MNRLADTTDPAVEALPRAAHALGALDDLVTRRPPLRAAIVGGAGSGKSDALAYLRTRLEREGRPTRALSPRMEVAAVEDAVTLLVDDAQELDDAHLGALLDRANRPEAGLVIAYRTWPAPAALVEITRIVEHDSPPLLLGEVTLAEVRTDLMSADAGCAQHILDATGGIAWLVAACVEAHDLQDCTADPEHRELARVVHRRIRHRLDTVSPALRRRIEVLSLGARDRVGTEDIDSAGVVAEGCAEGLLTANGRPVPLVAEVARASTSVDVLIELIRHGSLDLVPGSDLAACLDGVVDPALGAAIAERARAEVSCDPARAAVLFERAVACGVPESEIAAVRAHALWAAGDGDSAGLLLAGVGIGRDHADHDLAADILAVTWADRGMMTVADHTYRAMPPTSAAGGTRALVAAAGAGAIDPPLAPLPERAPSGPAAPSTLGVALDLLDRGLRATLSGESPREAVDDLRRAADLSCAARDTAPTPELPAVIAATAAIGIGDLELAHTVVSDALGHSERCRRWRPRLLLWNAWIAVQREQVAEARRSLSEATGDEAALTARDELIAAAITVELARRYDDAAALSAAWESLKSSVRRVEPDLYTLLPLSELVIVSARLGDADWMQPAFRDALGLVDRLGQPSVWATSLHWAGIQRGILQNRPDDLAPHAKALVDAARRNPLAARMAQAGRVWTSVLAGTIDPDAVEAAARGLATVGLAWDGARLAGHGARRSKDKKVGARLLACARELHPRETPAPREAATGPVSTASVGGLSEREQEIAHLVVQGRTYAEIGAELFISPRTAEHHIGQIRRRLAATSRSDLLAKLRVALGATEGAPR
ncbi:LuxR C-terminal-related transcriptional regulator [Microbacterium sp. SSW1-59]|uniref:LuxR C-terminal-related transcriptional regulator n=1 Tax=Microbacterium xanthum TaxID=3079794 RepID=UPI002AD59A84|nr:LuxR C-terminal-related transcriptional regulator [Microbacterium sp. SSW1-59]MDZ8201378.1 LuxR C-terminal-related transcriptional regulator [Microbacterium sp. SSW1-59]